MPRTAALAAALLLLVAGPAVAQSDTYRVDSAGGPLSLFEEVADAFAIWEQAGAAELPVEGDGARTLFRVAAPEHLGPDTVSVTLQRPVGEPALEVIVHPDLYRDHPAALVHETGIVLGLSAGTAGVMQPGLSADSPDRPDPEDVEQLRGLASAVPGDLNADGRVDFLDLLELAADFGRRGINLPADLDADGTVSEADLFRLRELYTFSPPEQPLEAAVPEEDAAAPESPEPVPEDSDTEPAGEPAAESEDESDRD